MPRDARVGHYALEDVHILGKAPRPPPISLSQLGAPTAPCVPSTPRGAMLQAGSGGVVSPRLQHIHGFARAVRSAPGIDPALQGDLLGFLGLFSQGDQSMPGPIDLTCCPVDDCREHPPRESRTQGISSQLPDPLQNKTQPTMTTACILNACAPVATANCPAQCHGQRNMRCGSHRAYRARQSRRLPKLSCETEEVVAGRMHLSLQRLTDKHGTPQAVDPNLVCGPRENSPLSHCKGGRSVSSRRRGKKKKKNRLIE